MSKEYVFNNFRKYAEKYKTLKNNTIEIYKKLKTENDFEY